jgi:hydroxymethylglutaryl-CoA reductase (NADPH)
MGPQEVLDQLQPRHDPPAPRIPGASLATVEAIARRWKLLPASAQADLWSGGDLERYNHNIENAVGLIQIPVAVAGPLRVNGCAAHGDFYVPLATTEAALVASYTRGCQLLSESGGCSTLVLAEGVSRAPGFVFSDLREVGAFVTWLLAEKDALRREAESTTRHGRLLDLRITVEGNHVYVIFEYFTGDAAGQNMVTIATQAACDYIRDHSPVKPKHIFVEANLSGDKKASAQSFQTVRGRKVAAECLIPADALAKRLHTDASAMEEYWRMSALGGVLSGGAGTLCQWTRGPVSRHRTGCGLRFRSGGGRHAIRGPAGRCAVRVGDPAKFDRRHRGRRNAVAHPVRLSGNPRPARSGSCPGPRRSRRRPRAGGRTVDHRRPGGGTLHQSPSETGAA